MQYHVNGDLVPADEATVSVRDRGFAYGDAAFETLRAYGGEVFEWPAHADRLQQTCKTLGFDEVVDRSDLHLRVSETLEANDLAEAYVRLSVTRGVQPGKLTPQPAVDPTIVVVVAPLPRGGRDGRPPWDDPATVALAETQRVPDAAVPAAAKTHNYLNGILARLELRGTTADEALLVDGDGAIAEGATSNLFLVDDGTLKTPSLAGPVLPGVTRAVVLELAREADIPVEEGTYRPAALRSADELFLTNSTWEIRPVGRYDGIPFEPGPVTGRLAERFETLVEERHYRS